MQLMFGLLLVSLSAAASAPVDVRLHFFEALAPRDTTSSQRFQKEYDEAIRTATSLVSQRLLSCGYRLQEQTNFYNATDGLEAFERAKASAEQGAWMFVGPRRSNHFVLLTKGAPNVPSISTMASSQEVSDLGRRHLSMAPFNDDMASVAAKEARREAGLKEKVTYVSIVSEDCIACVDFAQHFDTAAKRLRFVKQHEFKVNGDAPDLTQIVATTAHLKPTFVLLPNYSKVTAQAIAAIHKALPKAFYVGGDGWGDASFGFLQNAKDLDSAYGFSVRGFPSPEVALRDFPLGRTLLASKDETLKRPGSASTLAITKIIESTANLLCQYKPKTKDQFSAVFEKHGRGLFRSPWGVSVYNLKSGNISYGRTERGTLK